MSHSVKLPFGVRFLSRLIGRLLARQMCSVDETGVRMNVRLAILERGGVMSEIVAGAIRNRRWR